jgi:hypothetical protein
MVDGGAPRIIPGGMPLPLCPMLLSKDQDGVPVTTSNARNAFGVGTAFLVPTKILLAAPATKPLKSPVGAPRTSSAAGAIQIGESVSASRA